MPVAAEVTTLEDDRVRIDVTVPEDEVRKEFDRTVRETSSRMRLPGFRPGKVPAGVVITRVGREGLLAQTLDRALGTWYGEALRATDITPIDDPEVDLGDTAETGVAFAVTVRVPPSPTLGSYEGLEVMREPVETPEGAVEAEIDRIREQSARLEDVDRAAAEGDFLIIDYDGSVEGTMLPDAGSRGQLIELGGERILKEFTEALIGAVTGDQRTIAVEYPDDDTRDEIRGKTVEYAVTIQKVQAKVLPEVDDALAESVGFASADEMRREIEERLAAATERMVNERHRRRAIDAAVAEATLEVPEVMVNRRIDSILHDTSHQLPQGVTLEQFLAMQGQTVEQARESLRADAEMSIRRELVVEAIADAEDITLTDDEVEARVRADAADAGRDPEELLTALREAGGWESLRQDLRVERAVDLVVGSARDITPEEAEKREAAAAKADAPAEKKPAEKKPGEKKPGEKKPAAKKPAAKADAPAGTKAPSGKSPASGKAATAADAPAAKKTSAKKSGAKKPATSTAKGSGSTAAKKSAAAKPAAKKSAATKPAAKKPDAG